MMSDGAEGNAHLEALEAHGLVNVSQEAMDSVHGLRKLQAEVTGMYKLYLEGFQKIEHLRAAAQRRMLSAPGDTLFDGLSSIPAAQLQLQAPEESIDDVVEGGEAHQTYGGKSGELSEQIIDISPQGEGSASPSNTDSIVDKTYTALEPETFLNPQIPLTMRIQKGKTESGFTYVWVGKDVGKPIGIVSRIPFFAISENSLLRDLGRDMASLTDGSSYYSRTEQGRVYVFPLVEEEIALERVISEKIAYSLIVQKGPSSRLLEDLSSDQKLYSPQANILTVVWEISICKFSYDPQTREFSINEIDMSSGPKFSVKLVEDNQKDPNRYYDGRRRGDVRFGHAKQQRSSNGRYEWVAEPLHPALEGMLGAYQNVMRQFVQYTAETKQTLMTEKGKFAELIQTQQKVYTQGVSSAVASVLGSMFGIEDTVARTDKE